MSGRSYRQYFDKCKVKLISTLETSNDIEHRLVAQHLKSIKWSTHIGREHLQISLQMKHKTLMKLHIYEVILV